MENSKLFQVCEQGYNCSQVDEYIAAVKKEYKKLYEYSKKIDSTATCGAGQKRRIRGASQERFNNADSQRRGCARKQGAARKA